MILGSQHVVVGVPGPNSSAARDTGASHPDVVSPQPPFSGDSDPPGDDSVGCPPVSHTEPALDGPSQPQRLAYTPELTPSQTGADDDPSKEKAPYLSRLPKGGEK
jgi:hypothetical protein